MEAKIKVKIRASYTIENSYIIPIFTMVIVILIVITFYFHDLAIIKNILIQTAVKAENNIQTTQNSIDDLCNTSALNIKRRTIFTKGIKVEVKIEENDISAQCTAVFMGTGIFKQMGSIQKKEKIKQYYQPEYIRKINAVQKVIKG